MKIGCPRETKDHEYRVGLIPAAVRAYVNEGHEVFVQRGAGLGSGVTDEEYEAVGARLVEDAAEAWAADMVVKVKEPLPPEYPFLREGQLVFTYFHFAADEGLSRACLERRIIAVAYETVQERDGSLPLLKPMSEVAGRMAPLVGSYYLARVQGGLGLLPTGVPGVAPAKVLILGGGTVGSNAARVAAGLGADVIILDINVDTLEHLGNIMPPNVHPIFGYGSTFEEWLREADLVVGAVLIPGAKAPRLLKREHFQRMKPGSVFVDVAIDQGGCSETSRPTSHSDPVYVVDQVTHYCVTNMPGAYSRTSTFALNNRTIKYGLKLARQGALAACRADPALRKGLNLYRGWVTLKPVAEVFGLEQCFVPPEEILEMRE